MGMISLTHVTHVTHVAGINTRGEDLILGGLQDQEEVFNPL